MLLDGGSLALFAIFLARLIPLLLGANPMDPTWQDQFVDLLVTQGLLPFLGFVLLHLAVFLQPQHDRLRRRLRLVRRLAVPVVIGYVLLVPLQFSSSYMELSTAQSRQKKYQVQSAQLTEIREAIQEAASIQDLNVRLQSLLQPELSSEQLNQQLPALRKTLLKANDTQQQQVTRQLMKNSADVDSFASVISRVGSALGWAFAFACGAVPWGSRSTLLERWRRR